MRTAANDHANSIPTTRGMKWGEVERKGTAPYALGRVQGPMRVDHENRGEIGFTFTSATLSGQEPT